jgi:peptidoglycan/xylan/chitin deacetylase (PgdA/CDA1 family)
VAVKRSGAQLALLAALCSAACSAHPAGQPERFVAVTFDDLPLTSAHSTPIADQEALTERLVSVIEAHRVPAVGFVNEGKLWREGALDERRVNLLRRWVRAGLELGNHGRSHLDLHRVPVDSFIRDMERGDDVTRRLLSEAGREPRYFRHPYLHTGRSSETRSRVLDALARRGYQVAPVTIDNSEWIFAAAYENAADSAARAQVRRSYLEYMEQVFAWYETQSREVLGRDIPHVLLLHANLLNADSFDALARMIRARGYVFVPLEQALADSAYRSADSYTGQSGLSWLHRWALTRGAPASVMDGAPEVPSEVRTAAQRPTTP